MIWDGLTVLSFAIAVVVVAAVALGALAAMDIWDCYRRDVRSGRFR